MTAKCHICGEPTRENRSVDEEGYTAYYHDKCLKEKFPHLGQNTVELKAEKVI
ncbi:hypothetical protein ACFL6S_25140 [Candidatus Poribacteria bacterium]